MDDRFIEVPFTLLPDDTLTRLLGEFVSRQGADSTDTLDGERGWVAQLMRQLQCGNLLIMHDMLTETTEVLTHEQWRDVQRRRAAEEDDYFLR